MESVHITIFAYTVLLVLTYLSFRVTHGTPSTPKSSKENKMTTNEFGSRVAAAAEDLLRGIKIVVPKNQTEVEIILETTRLLNSLLDGAMALKRL